MDLFAVHADANGFVPQAKRWVVGGDETPGMIALDVLQFITIGYHELPNHGMAGQGKNGARRWAA
jgi:hypothetical protein